MQPGTAERSLRSCCLNTMYFSAQNLVKSIQRQIFQMTDTTVDYKLKVLTVSVGISAAPYAAKTAKELLDNADMAVNHVKRTGKNGIKIFDTILRENSVRGRCDRSQKYLQRI